MSADSGGIDEPCAAWETWAEFLGAEKRLPKSWDGEGWLVEYLSYIIVAVSVPAAYFEGEPLPPLSSSWRSARLS